MRDILCMRNWREYFAVKPDWSELEVRKSGNYFVSTKWPKNFPQSEQVGFEDYREYTKCRIAERNFEHTWLNHYQVRKSITAYAYRTGSFTTGDFERIVSDHLDQHHAHFRWGVVDYNTIDVGFLLGEWALRELKSIRADYAKSTTPPDP